MSHFLIQRCEIRGFLRMCFKKWAVIEFLGAKKESVTNIPKRIKCTCTLSLLLMKVILAVGLMNCRYFIRQNSQIVDVCNVTSFILLDIYPRIAEEFLQCHNRLQSFSR